MPGTLPALDTPPPDNVWTEHDDLSLTPREIATGNGLGSIIATSNDEDNGMCGPSCRRHQGDPFPPNFAAGSGLRPGQTFTDGRPARP
jgi:hypothetical protein